MPKIVLSKALNAFSNISKYDNILFIVNIKKVFKTFCEKLTHL